MGGLAAWLMQLQFTLFGISINLGDIAGSLNSLLSFTQISSLSYATSMAGAFAGAGSIEGILFFLSGSLKAIALQLLFLYCLWHLIGLAMDVEHISWHQIFFVIVKFFLFKFLITYSGNFFSLLFEIGDGLLDQFESIFGAIETSKPLWSTIADDIDNASWGFSIFGISLGPLLAFIVFLLFYMPLMGTYIALIAQVFYRIFKIITLIAVAPIPIALCSFGQVESKRFILQAVSIVLEGLVMMVMIHLYAIGVGSLSIQAEEGQFMFMATMLALIVLNAVLSLGLSQATNLSERWLAA